jgi:hypothetical protein
MFVTLCIYSIKNTVHLRKCVGNSHKMIHKIVQSDSFTSEFSHILRHFNTTPMNLVIVESITTLNDTISFLTKMKVKGKRKFPHTMKVNLKII